MLTDVACKNAKCPEGRLRARYAASRGLYLEVTRLTTAGQYGENWRWKYLFSGREKRLALEAVQKKIPRELAPLRPMTEERHALDDAQWERLAGLVPSDRGRPGGSKRQFLNALLWIAMTGSPWRDLPSAL